LGSTAASKVEQILRITFHSGRVVEKRGDDETVELMFSMDEQRLIDYVMSIDLETGAVAFFSDEEDDRFTHAEALVWPFTDVK
jgi:hypothetical protein